MESLISSDIAASVEDSLTSSICIVDLAGQIVGVNRAWVEFSLSNGGSNDKGYLGTNYFDACRSRGARPLRSRAGSVRGCAGCSMGRTRSSKRNTLATPLMSSAGF